MLWESSYLVVKRINLVGKAIVFVVMRVILFNGEEDLLIDDNKLICSLNIQQ